MHFRLLGPVEAWREGRRLALGGPKPRALLAALLLEPGRVVSADALIDAIWGDNPPDTARSLIQSYESALRRALSPDVIETQPPGYLIHADAVVVDRAAFERLTAQGRKAASSGDHAGAARLLSEALALWRGPALGGIGETLRAMADQLEEARQAALEERIAADLAQGGPRDGTGRRTHRPRRHPPHARAAARPTHARPLPLGPAGRRPRGLRRRPRRTSPRSWASTPGRASGPCTRPSCGATRNCCPRRGARRPPPTTPAGERRAPAPSPPAPAAARHRRLHRTRGTAERDPGRADGAGGGDGATRGHARRRRDGPRRHRQIRPRRHRRTPGRRRLPGRAALRRTARRHRPRGPRRGPRPAAARPGRRPARGRRRAQGPLPQPGRGAPSAARARRRGQRVAGPPAAARQRHLRSADHRAAPPRRPAVHAPHRSRRARHGARRPPPRTYRR